MIFRDKETSGREWASAAVIWASYRGLASPLDVIITRSQAYHGCSQLLSSKLIARSELALPRCRGVFGIQQIVNQEGIRALYRGLIPGSVYSILQYSLFSLLWQRQTFSENQSGQSSHTMVNWLMFPALLASIHSIQVYRTQSVMEGFFSFNAPVLRRFLRNGRVYSGAFAMVASATISTTSFYPLISYHTNTERELQLPLIALSALIGQIMSYPLETISVNQQLIALSKKESLVQVCKGIYSTSGLAGFYGGFFVSLARILPAFATFSLVHGINKLL
jgi:hypothetical protein